MGWHHSIIYNHISTRVPGTQSHFLINPFGLLYNEITASNLLKVDIDGNKTHAVAVSGADGGLCGASLDSHGAGRRPRRHPHALQGRCGRGLPEAGPAARSISAR